MTFTIPEAAQKALKKLQKVFNAIMMRGVYYGCSCGSSDLIYSGKTNEFAVCKDCGAIITEKI